MTNNEEKMDKTKKRINEILAERSEKFAERDSVKGTLNDKVKAFETINADIVALNKELSDIGRELEEKDSELNYKFKKVTSSKENKGKKVLVHYKRHDKDLKAHLVESNKGKFNAIIDEINTNDALLAYYKENAYIDEKGIKSHYSIDEDAVANMNDEEKMEYFNDFCIKIADPNTIVGPVAKRVITGTRYVIINACDEKIYLECLSRYKEALFAVESKKNDHIRMQAVEAILNQAIKVSPIEVSKFKIDWDYVRTLDSLEKRAEYFNNLAKEIAASPKENPEKVPLGKNSSAVVNSCDKYIFLQCFTEYSKAIKEIKRKNTPSYKIDWDYVNLLDSADKKADYFEDLCGKIDSVEKVDPIEISFRGHVFTVNKVDKEVFETAMNNFEKFYLEALKEKQAEQERLRIEEEKRKQEELEKQRIEEEKKKQEELERLRIEEEKKKQEELERLRIEEERKQEELEKQRQEEEKRKQEEAKKIMDIAAKAKMLEVAQKAADALAEKNRMDSLEAKIVAEANKIAVQNSNLALSEEEKDDYNFLTEEKDGVRSIAETASVLDELDGFGEFQSGGSEVDFFDADDEFEEEIEELEEEIVDKDDKIDKELEQTNTQDLKTIEEVAEELGGSIEEISGLQFIDLNDDKKQIVVEKEESLEPEKKKSLKDRILGKFGKKDKNDKNNGGSAGGSANSDVKAEEETIEIFETEALKVLESKEYLGNISESKLYTIRKNLYLSIMDWIVDQQIREKVQIVTKRQTAEVDAKYAEVYNYFAKKYEALEDKYERYSQDKYHSFKVKMAVGAPLALCSLALIAILSRDAYNSRTVQADGTNALNNEIGIENNNIYDNLVPKDITKIDELIDDSLEHDESKDDSMDETVNEESRVNTPSYEWSYPYAGYNAPEAFNVQGGQYYSEEDVTDEIRSAAEANKTPILEFVR